MPSVDLVVSVPVKRTVRVKQVEGIFDLDASAKSERCWSIELPIDEREWKIGLICGASGSGKSSLARKLWPDRLAEHEWPADQSVLDGFPRGQSVKDITALLSSVGFSSPPSWLRPYRVLSTGEQFRCDVARSLAERDLAVIDEFTSVVDRTVAKVGSAAVAKAVRKRDGQRLVAVSCHEDIAEWLEPDWIYGADTGEFSWGCLQRPSIKLRVQRVSPAAWELFRRHHYLDTSLNQGARCFAAFWDERPVAFSAWLPQPGVTGMRREHRTVVLPDFQGVGVGSQLSTCLASMWAALGCRAVSSTSHPALASSRATSLAWRLVRSGMNSGHKGSRARGFGAGAEAHSRRYMCAFEFAGPPMDRDAALSLLGEEPRRATASRGRVVRRRHGTGRARRPRVASASGYPSPRGSGRPARIQSA